MEHPECFISYSWDSEEHKAWVRSFAETLQRSDVYVHLDQWDAKLGMDLPQYMGNSIRESDFVILVCTPRFAEKANKGAGGVGYEKSIVTGEIFTSSCRQTKFIPIIREGFPSASLPSYLKSKLYVDFTIDSEFQSGFEQILRHLHESPSVSRPPLGEKPSFLSGGTDTEMTRLAGTQPKMQPAGLSNKTSPSFDLVRFRQLKAYAYSSDGLDLTNPGAVNWAEERLKDTPPFDLERFKQLKAYAYSSDGLDLTNSGAIDWAMTKLQET